MSRRVKLLIGIPIALVVLAVGGTWAYFAWIEGDAPAPLDRTWTELIDREEPFPWAEPRQDFRDVFELCPVLGVWARENLSGFLELVAEFLEVLRHHAS